MADLIKTRTMVARKPHQCRTCYQTAVQPGQQYKRDTYAFDGHVYDWVNCADCAAASPYVFKWAAGYADEGINEEVFEEWARDIGWEADIDETSHNAEQSAALNFLKRYRGTVVDHSYTPVASHSDDNECTFRADGTDSTYCGKREDEHLWSSR